MTGAGSYKKHERACRQNWPRFLLIFKANCVLSSEPLMRRRTLSVPTALSKIALKFSAILFAVAASSISSRA